MGARRGGLGPIPHEAHALRREPGWVCAVEDHAFHDVQRIDRVWRRRTLDAGDCGLPLRAISDDRLGRATRRTIFVLLLIVQARHGLPLALRRDVRASTAIVDDIIDPRAADRDALRQSLSTAAPSLNSLYPGGGLVLLALAAMPALDLCPQLVSLPGPLDRLRRGLPLLEQTLVVRTGSVRSVHALHRRRSFCLPPLLALLLSPHQLAAREGPSLVRWRGSRRWLRNGIALQLLNALASGGVRYRASGRHVRNHRPSGRHLNGRHGELPDGGRWRLPRSPRRQRCRHVGRCSSEAALPSPRR
mmetsp:Transcript_49987/g.143904  ORF Transcript_49987/g.143904 Transcript_49987/m.143904 type:complete len:303 (+) Transcript_49987:333-1241(+)